MCSSTLRGVVPGSRVIQAYTLRTFCGLRWRDIKYHVCGLPKSQESNPMCPNTYVDDNHMSRCQKVGYGCPRLELLPSVHPQASLPFPPLPSTRSATLGPTAHSAPVLSDAARPALPQPPATAARIIDHSAGILSTLGLAGRPLINNLVRVMDSVRIIA